MKIEKVATTNLWYDIIMVMIKNFYHLKFFNNPLKSNFTLPKSEHKNYANQRWYLHYYQGDEHNDLINDDILAWADKNNLKVEHCHIFAGPPNEQQDIHTDGPIGISVFGINYVLSGHDSYMAWYNATDNCDYLTTSASHPFRRWNDNECVEIERDALSGPTLINASTPHRVVNNSNEYRWSLSLRFKNNFSSWEETVKFFKPYILE